jgi:hypothetical protein
MKETRMTRPIYPQHALAATFISGRQRPNESTAPDAASPLCLSPAAQRRGTGEFCCWAE